MRSRASEGRTAAPPFSSDVVSLRRTPRGVVPIASPAVEATLDALPGLDPETRALAELQSVTDVGNAVFAPRLLFNTELVPLGHGEPTSIKLGKLIALNPWSAIYHVAGKAKLVIKYQANCDYPDDVHPLLRDYWFQRSLDGLGITPKVYFVSPPVKLGFPITPKTRFTSSLEERIECAARPSSTVRYMVMDRVRSCVGGLAGELDSVPPLLRFQYSMRVIRITIRHLQAIHQRGIVHGDIHTGNVVMLEGDESAIGLIDFGLAFFASARIGTRERVRDRLSYVHCLHSVYELEGFRASYRDDVYRAVLTGAIILGGRALLDYCQGLQSDGEAMLKFKNEDFLFQHPGGLDRIASIPEFTPGIQAVVRECLSRVLMLVRNIHAIDELPPYEAILAELEAIRGLPGKSL